MVSQTKLPILAVHGGRPVRDPSRPWPRWPQPSPEVQANLAEVVGSDRWTLTSQWGSSGLFERRFAEMFAAYTGTRHCVPVDHGSSALVVALESLKLSFGDRVLVPALTWVASATAALRAGLVPILVDVDSELGCMGPEHLDAEVGAKAAVVVHWSAVMADAPRLVAAADRHGIEIVEDCAQAHGAEWLGRPAGSWGRLGCFSMQQGKVLTCGEGGAVVTDDDDLATALQELRADSRRYRADSTDPALEESAGILGSNFCLSEFGAAVLCAQLPVLDGQHARRNHNFRLLDELLTDVPGVRLIRPRPEQTKMSIYELAIVFDPLPPAVTAEHLADALTAELHRPFYQGDPPLHRSRLLQPWTKPTLQPLTREFVECNKDRKFTATEDLYDRCVVTHHSTLLGDAQDMHDIASAIARVASPISWR